MPRDLAEETFPPPPYLHWHYADGAPPLLTLPSHLSHPLIHLLPLCSVSLPPTTHHLLRPIITRSTSPLQLPWQQLCWAQVPVSPVVTGLPLTTIIYWTKNKLNQLFLTPFLLGMLTHRGSSMFAPEGRFLRHQIGLWLRYSFT